MPSEAGILNGRIPDCFGCAIEMRGLTKANAEADFFFIWGYLGCRSPRQSADFAKDGRILHRTNLLEKRKRSVKTSLREFFLLSRKDMRPVELAHEGAGYGFGRNGLRPRG
jgi:hypothetical protein